MMQAVNLRRLRAMILKETFQILRDPSSLMVAFLLPVMMIFLFGYGVSLDPTSMKMGLVQQSAGGHATGLANSFVNSRYFDVSPGQSIKQFEDDLVAGSISGIVVIPSQFDRNMDSGSPQPLIQIITDGSNPNAAKFFANYSQGVFNSWQQQTREEAGIEINPPVILNTHFLYNEQLASRFFLIPGSMAIILTMVGSLLTSLLIAREWERGTMETLISTPITVFELILAKLIPYVILGLLSSAICILLAIFVFGLPFHGSMIILVLLLLAFLIPSLAQGLLISTLTKSQFVASQIALITAFMPAFLLSGFIFEIASMPRWVQAITYVFPGRYLVPPLQSIFLTGNVYELLLPNMAILMGFGIFFIAITLRVTKKHV